jgi:hypothetical protein
VLALVPEGLWPNAHLSEKFLRMAIMACDWLGGGQG